MSDIAAANVTYSFSTRNKAPIGKLGYKSVGTIAFGNSSLTVPAAGIPLTKASMLCPHVVHSLQVLGSNVVGYTYEYDATNVKLKICNVPTLTAALTGNAATLTGNLAAKGLTLEKKTPTGNVAAPVITIANAAANATLENAIWSNSGVLSHSLAEATNVTGVQAPKFTGDEITLTGNVTNAVITMDSYTPAGTIAVTGSGAKLSAYTGAIASCVLTVEVIGW